MKSMVKTLSTLSLFIMLAVASVSAQSNSDLRVNIPFDFAAGKAQFKAGEYILRSSPKGVLVLRRIHDKTDTFILAPSTIQRPDSNLSGKLVFHRYGNEYFLAEVWTSRNTIGRSMNQADAERRLARVRIQTEFVEVAEVIQ